MTPTAVPNLIGGSGQQWMLTTIQIGRTADEELGLGLGLGLRSGLGLYDSAEGLVVFMGG